uniref:Uncharacterized protein n=1 Tax=Anguilla anguilla TaxID=7936 RepID=A0A0E9RIZ8_ANGAN
MVNMLHTLYGLKYVDAWHPTSHPKFWALIWSWFTLCCHNNLHYSGKVLY